MVHAVLILSMIIAAKTGWDKELHTIVHARCCEEVDEKPPISNGLAFAMVFEKGVPLPIDAEYEDPVTKRIAQRMQAAKDEMAAATRELIIRYNLSTDVEGVAEVPKDKKDRPAPQYCHICNEKLHLHGVNSLFCPCWAEADTELEEKPPFEADKPPIEDEIFPYREICSRMGCSRLHDDACCLCGLALCEEHMASGCCGHTPAISDRAITEEFHLEDRYGNEANEEQAVQEVQYV